MRQDRRLLVLMLACVVAYFAAQSYIAAAIRDDVPSVQRASPLGLSIFHELRQKLHPDRLQVLAKPFLRPDVVPHDALLLLLAPSRPISRFEAKQMETFARRGGTVLATFHSAASYTSLTELNKLISPSSPFPISSLSLPSLSPRAHLIDVAPTSNDDLLRKGESYRFYTLAQLPRAKAAKASPADFYRHKTIGTGHLYVLASVPPLSNGLIRLGDNATLAARLALLPGSIVIDEYHHFFTEKTTKDLLLDARVSLPLLGLILLMLLYFLFGDATPSLASPQAAAQRSYHEFNVGLIAKQLQQPAALAEAAEVVRANLVRLYPEARRDLIPAPLSLNDLIRWHSHLLTSKGGNQP